MPGMPHAAVNGQDPSFAGRIWLQLTVGCGLPQCGLPGMKHTGVNHHPWSAGRPWIQLIAGHGPPPCGHTRMPHARVKHHFRPEGRPAVPPPTLTTSRTEAAIHSCGCPAASTQGRAETRGLWLRPLVQLVAVAELWLRPLVQLVAVAELLCNVR